jgi:hypothetical protein
MSLKYRVFQNSYIGHNGTSTLFYGERDAVLIDTAGHVLSSGVRTVGCSIL